LRKVGRGVKRAAKGTVKVVKKAAYIAVTPQRLALKYGLKGLKLMGKFAARPIRGLYRKLAMRRARLLSWRARRSLAPTAAEKAQGGRYALGKMGGNPLGKLGVGILKATWGTSVSGAELRREVATVGMTGAEIAAAAASVVAAVTKIISSLNKPGEAPENPQTSEPAEATEPSSDDEGEETSGAIYGKKAYRGRKTESSEPYNGPSADQILWEAQRYGGYRSRKEQVKAARQARERGE
jgi:hypothetical protein